MVVAMHPGLRAFPAAIHTLRTSMQAHDRREACSALAGAVGLPAIRVLVDALDDGNSDVRAAALNALATSSTGPHALRLVHAVCHRRVDVRVAAAGIATLAPALLAVALGDADAAVVARHTLGQRLRPEPALVAVVLRARRAGHLDDDAACELLCAVAWQRSHDVFAALPTAGTYRVDAPHLIGDDPLIDLITLAAKHDALCAAFVAGVHPGMVRGAIDEPARLRFAACVALLVPAGVPTALLAIAASADPRVLAITSADDARAAAVQLVHSGVAHHSAVFAAVALPSSVADLAQRAGLLRLCRETPYLELLRAIDVDTIANAWRDTVVPALVALPPTNADDRAALATLLHRLVDGMSVENAALLLLTSADPHPVLAWARSEADAVTLFRAALIVDDGAVREAGAAAAVLEMRHERAFTLLARRLGSALPAAVAAALTIDVDSARTRLSLRVLCTEAHIEQLAHAAEHAPHTVERIVAHLPAAFDVDSAPAGVLRTALAQRAEALHVRELTDTEVAALTAASDIAAATWACVRGRRRHGVVPLLASVSASADAACALLSSYDAIHDVAATLACLPTATEIVVQLRPHIATLPLAGLCAVVVAEADEGTDTTEALRALRLEVQATPGGLRGLLTLAGALPGPVGGLLVDAAHHLAVDDRSLISDRVIDAACRAQSTASETAAAAFQRFLALFAPPVASEDHAVVDDELACVFGADTPAFQRWLASHTPASLLPIIEVLLAHGDVPPAHLVEIVRACGHPQATTAALEHTHDPDAQAALLRLLPSSSSAALAALQAAAEWGARSSLALVGRPIAVSYVGDTLGFTRIGSSSIHINPLPLLLGERRGDDIVRGLIAHELGHHRYHGAPDDLKVWQQAQREQLGALLNLVADEHLERNLRALSSSRYGDRLQALAAWAFQHRRKEMSLSSVLAGLGPRAAAVLVGATIGVARDPNNIVVDVGGLVARLQRTSPFARFMHALRLGKGAHHDAVVERALTLCRGPHFRRLRLSGLLQIARRLRDLFHDDKALPELLDLHALTSASAHELAAGGVPLDELQRHGASTSAREHTTRPGPRPHAVVDTAVFSPITHIERVPFDGAAARRQVVAAARGAQLLRHTLQRLGEQHHVVKHRAQGQRLDRSQLGRQVILRDPRMLTARTSARLANVAIVVLIDCSGSMAGARLQRAQRFAATVAAAALSVRGVDVRFAGFTDTTIFDAGTAERCAIAGLVANGGNNDAAALSWATDVVLRLPRQQRLIVMVSDDAPTECSPAAVRHVVNRATARGIWCLQVAVAPIGEVCFPRHLLLDGDDVDAAARRFAEVLARGVIEQRTHAAPHFVADESINTSAHSDDEDQP